MSEQAVALVRGYYELLNARDYDRCSELLSADFQLVEPSLPDGGSYRGPDGWRRWLKGIDEAWSYARWERDDFIDAGEYVIVPVRFVSTGAHTAIEQVATRVHTIRVQGGLVTFATGYRTLAQARKAVGLGE